MAEDVLGDWEEDVVAVFAAALFLFFFFKNGKFLITMYAAASVWM
jgi:hypothetical protein